jgi:DNA-binding XRE family transcriptional regulator
VTEIQAAAVFTWCNQNCKNYKVYRKVMKQTVSKFSPITIDVKRKIRQLRLQKGFPMNEAASLLGVSRKQLEDIETVRNYGCHLDLELLAKIKVIYGVSLDEIFGDLPADYYSDYYVRPRKKLAD